jgi:hypothetical protein
MILSVRDIARAQLDRTGDLSVNEDLYGYIHRDDESRLFGARTSTDRLPGAAAGESPTTRSLRRHLETISDRAVSLTIILVQEDEVNVADAAKVQYAIQVARDVFAQADLGIRRVYWDEVSPGYEGEYLDITSMFEAWALTGRANGPDGTIDVFVTHYMHAAVGRSPTPGVCEKGGFEFMDGVVIAIRGNKDGWITPRYTGIALAHELGHYLGLDHSRTVGNLMCGGVNVLQEQICDTSDQQTDLTAEQGAKMKRHCAVT